MSELKGTAIRPEQLPGHSQQEVGLWVPVRPQAWPKPWQGRSQGKHEPGPGGGQQPGVPNAQPFQPGAHIFPAATLAPKDAHTPTPELAETFSCMARRT